MTQIESGSAPLACLIAQLDVASFVPCCCQRRGVLLQIENLCKSGAYKKTLYK